jgi:hypothetical protein
MTSLEDVQDTILARIKTLGAEKKFGVFETAIPLGYEATERFGQHEPYVLIGFGGQSSVSEDLQGITGTVDDLKWTSVAAEVVSNSPSTSRRIAGIIRTSLEGYVPDERWGQLVEQMSGDYTVKNPEYDLWPVRFARGMVFTTNSNA